MECLNARRGRPESAVVRYQRLRFEGREQHRADVSDARIGYLPLFWTNFCDCRYSTPCLDKRIVNVAQDFVGSIFELSAECGNGFLCGFCGSNSMAEAVNDD